MKKTTVHVILTLVSLIYGANYSIAKQVMPNFLQPFGFIVLRVCAATLIFWVIFIYKGFVPIQNRKDAFRMALCALFGIAINQLFFFKGLHYTKPINASLIMVTTPIVVLIVSRIMLKEAISLYKILGVALGACGTLILLSQHTWSWGNEYLLGDLMIFINATSYSIYLVLVKPLLKKYDTFTLITWLFLIGSIYVLPFGWHEFSVVNWSKIPITIYLCITFVVICTTVLAYSLNAQALNYVSPTIVGYYIFLQPLFAAFIAILIGADTLSINKILPTILLFLGVLLVNHPRG